MSHSPLTIEQVHQEFIQWRATKAHDAVPIPEPLWEQVFRVVEQYPTAHVLRRLGISTRQFKAKRQAASAEPALPFIAIPLSPSLYPLELTLPTQVKLNLHLPFEQLGGFVQQLMQG